MKSFYRWIADHPRISRALMALVISGICFVILNPNLIPIIPRFLTIFLLLSSGFTYLNTIPERLLREPLHILEHQCDPYPLLEELEHQMPHCREDLQGMVTRINYSMALGHTGQYEQALENLEDVDLNRFPHASPFIRFFYHHNLTDLYTKLGNFDLAEISCREAEAVYDSIPVCKAKNNLDKTIQMVRLRALYREGDYEAALRGLGRLNCPTPRTVMDAALLAAQCDLALADFGKAREKLQYVAANANRLACAEEARQLLATCPEN